MKILFNLKSLATKGGAERALLALVEELVRRGHQIEITVRDPKGTKPAYPVPGGVSIFYLGTLDDGSWRRHLPQCLISHQSRFNRHVEQNQYDLIVGWLRYGGAMVGWAHDKTDAPTIVAMRNLPYNLEPPRGNFPKLLRFYHRRGGFERADKIFVQMPQFIGMMPKTWQDKTVVIPNAAAMKSLQIAPPAHQSREKLIVAVSRLVEVKRLNHLIWGFAIFAKSHPDWRLEIWGQGKAPACSAYQELIDRAGVQGSARLMGTTDDIDSVYRRARILAHPSRREGMSNSVAEAMAYELAIVASNDCHGMSELIRHGETGIMIAGGKGGLPLANQIADALTELVDGPERAQRLGKQARQHLQSSFSSNVIYDQWEEELLRVAGLDAAS